MNQSQKVGVWSIVGLLGSLAIAWYFSRRQVSVRETGTPDNSQSNDNGLNQYTFNIPPLTVPQISVTIPPPAVIPGSGSGTPAQSSGCGCNPCGGTGYVSGSDALNSAIQNSQQWDTLVQNTVAPKTQIIKSVSPRPYEPLVLDDPNYPGHANPNPYLYSHDSVYKMAYDNALATWRESHQRSSMTNHDIFISLHMETGYALQEIQQYLFLYGDDPNANAIKPVAIH